MGLIEALAIGRSSMLYYLGRTNITMGSLREEWKTTIGERLHFLEAGKTRKHSPQTPHKEVNC